MRDINLITLPLDQSDEAEIFFSTVIFSKELNEELIPLQVTFQQ